MAGKTVRIPEQLHDLFLRIGMTNISMGVTVSIMQNLELVRVVKSPTGKLHWVDYDGSRMDFDTEGRLEGDFEFILWFEHKQQQGESNE